jgi:hypothetical protein
VLVTRPVVDWRFDEGIDADALLQRFGLLVRRAN